MHRFGFALLFSGVGRRVANPMDLCSCSLVAQLFNYYQSVAYITFRDVS